MSWKWLDDSQSKRENERMTFIVLGALLVIVVMLIIGFIISKQFFNKTLPVDVLLNRSGNDIVVRFPERPDSRQEEVLINPLIHTDGAITASRLFVSRFGGQADAEGNTIPLSTTHWVAWNALRTEWCLHPPPNDPVPEPAFHIGVNCPQKSAARLPRLIFQMSPAALPASLRALLEAIPSPGCADPLCGW